MNILQTEDLIKGLPDDRLMTEAKAPTGQVPQFMVVSEIQRRSDMRKRFAAQEEQPEGTIADQIIGGASQGPPPMRQPQQQMQGPPNMPFPLPTGEGIIPSGMPPQQNPNAALVPNGMAGGGITRMFGGGAAASYGSSTMTVPIGGQNVDVNLEGYNSVEDALDAFFSGRNPPAGSSMQGAGVGGLDDVNLQIDPVAQARQAAMPEINPPSVSSTSFTSVPRETDVGNVDLGIRSLPETPVTEADNARKMAAAKELMTGFTPSGMFDRFGDAVDSARSVLNTYNAVGMPSPLDAFTGAEEASAPEVFAPEQAGIAAIAPKEELPEATPQGEKQPSSKFTGTPQHTKAAGAQVQGLPGFVKQREEMPSMEDMLERQRGMAWNNAIVQLGAGIAGNDLSGGLSAAGTAMTQGSNALAMQQIQQMGQDRRLAETLAQRREEARMGGTSGTADIRTAEWFISQTPEIQKAIMKFKGRTMPEDEINKLVATTIAKRAQDPFGEPMTPEEAINLTNMLRSQYGFKKVGGGQVVAVSTRAEYDALPSKTVYKVPDGTTRTKP